MKKILALALCLALCVSLIACGSSEDTPVVSPTNPAIDDAKHETEPVELEAGEDEAQGFQTIYMLTPEQAEEYYQAIMSGEVTGGGTEFIKKQDEYVAKVYLDVMTNIWGEDVLSGLSACSGVELDQILTEVVYMASPYLAPENEGEEEEEFATVDDLEAILEGHGRKLVLYCEELSRSVTVEFDLDHAFLEPDWALMTDSPENYFVSLDNNGEVFTILYGTLSQSTSALIDGWIQDGASKGQEITVTDIETFTAGGIKWEVFALVYETTGTGINKETGKEETFVNTVYSPVCFARPDSETFLQVNFGRGISEEVLVYCQTVVQNCIRNITVD